MVTHWLPRPVRGIGWRVAILSGVRVGLAIALASVVHADDDGGSTSPPPPLLERQNLTGDWFGVRPALSTAGLKPYLVYTSTLWGNVNGGQTTGVQLNGYLDAGIDVDFHQMGLWHGFGAHPDFHWYEGREPTQRLIGGLAAMALSGWEAAATFRVYNLYLRQSLGENDRFVIKLGQIAADGDFMISRYGGVFLNAAFGDLPSQNLNLDAPVYPLAGPGIFLAAQFDSWLKGRFGAYTGDAGEDVAGNHGFEWKLGDNAGYTMFWELAATPPAQWLPATYTLGAIYDTGGADQFGPAADRTAHYELYAMVDQALVADDSGAPVLGAFARIAGSSQDRANVVSVYGDGGLAWFGPIPSRPDDVLGIAFSVPRFTDDFQQQEQAAGTPVGGGETALEATYQIAVAPWLIVQPDAQFFFNPSTSRRNAQALGCEVSVVF